LTEGKERFYIKSFYDRLVRFTEILFASLLTFCCCRQAIDPSFLSREDLDVYEKAFTRPGAMHAGFEVYRALLRDGDDVRENIAKHGKMQMPVLASGGESSPLTEVSRTSLPDVRLLILGSSSPKNK
jgi:hypothetical protein